jgi:hypothetical protein
VGAFFEAVARIFAHTRPRWLVRTAVVLGRFGACRFCLGICPAGAIGFGRKPREAGKGAD